MQEIFEISRRPGTSHDRRKPAPAFPAWTLPSAYANYPYYTNYKPHPLPPPPPPPPTLPSNATTSHAIFGLPTKPTPPHTTIFGHNYCAPHPPCLQKQSPPPAHSQRPFESSGQMTSRSQWDDIYKQFTIPANRMAGSGGRAGSGGGYKSVIRGPPRPSTASAISNSANISSNNTFIDNSNINNNNIAINSDNNIVNKNNNNNSATKWYTTPRLQQVQHVQHQQRTQNAMHTSPLIDLTSGDTLRVKQAIARRALSRKGGGGRGERERVLVADPLPVGVYPSGRSLSVLPTGGSSALSNSGSSLYSMRSSGIVRTTAPTSSSISGQPFTTSTTHNTGEGVLNLSSKTSGTPQASSTATAHHFIEGLRRHLDALPTATTWEATSSAAATAAAPGGTSLPLDLSRPPRASTRSLLLPQHQQDIAVDYSRRANVVAVTSTAAPTIPLLLTQYVYPVSKIIINVNIY